MTQPAEYTYMLDCDEPGHPDNLLRSCRQDGRLWGEACYKGVGSESRVPLTHLQGARHTVSRKTGSALADVE